MEHSLLYLYIKAVITDKNEIVMDVIDSLKFNTADFYDNILSNLKLDNTSDENIKIFNLFCIVAERKTIKSPTDIIVQKTRQAFENIIKKGIFDIKPLNLNDTKDIIENFSNIYINYIINSNSCPNIFKIELNDISFSCFYGSPDYLRETPIEIPNIINFWYQREQPFLTGKQILTRTILL